MGVQGVVAHPGTSEEQKRATAREQAAHGRHQMQRGRARAQWTGILSCAAMLSGLMNEATQLRGNGYSQREGSFMAERVPRTTGGDDAAAFHNAPKDSVDVPTANVRQCTSTSNARCQVQSREGHACHIPIEGNTLGPPSQSSANFASGGGRSGDRVLVLLLEVPRLSKVRRQYEGLVKAWWDGCRGRQHTSCAEATPLVRKARQGLAVGLAVVQAR
ncbi:hypothetical protein C8R44DRAFT_733208 [Mycena epipterygia]|nr:hypothetical protein C8R44DRAFT_733208 [Mycena epipterygia]